MRAFTTMKMTKTIKLSDNAYAVLDAQKIGKETFSHTVLRLTGELSKRTPLSSFAGIWKGDKEVENIYKKILRDRHRQRPRWMDFETGKHRRG